MRTLVGIVIGAACSLVVLHFLGYKTPVKNIIDSQCGKVQTEQK